MNWWAVISPKLTNSLYLELTKVGSITTIFLPTLFGLLCFLFTNFSHLFDLGPI